MEKKEDSETTKEEARYWQDKMTLDSLKSDLCTINDLQILNVLPENYLRWFKEKPKVFFEEVVANYEVGKQKIDMIWESDLPNYVEEDKQWLIEKLIPSKSVCILTGKRGTMKTFISLLIAYSIASGEDFLNYQTSKGKVLYLDKENGIGIMKERTAMIKKGMNFNETYEIGFICFSTLKIDKTADIAAIEELIKKEKPQFLIVDTYRRSVSFDENDAGEVSKLFVDILRPLVEKYNFSVLLIHHNRKSAKSNGRQTEEEGVDEMDELRGSSDLANYVDCILKIDRLSEKSLILKQLKNRNAREEKPIKIKVDFAADSLKLSYDGEFIHRTNVEKCAEYLIEWFNDYKIKHFKTKEAEQIAFKKGIKERNFTYAIQDLCSKGIIEKIERGGYDVKIN